MTSQKMCNSNSMSSKCLHRGNQLKRISKEGSLHLLETFGRSKRLTLRSEGGKSLALGLRPSNNLSTRLVINMEVLRAFSEVRILKRDQIRWRHLSLSIIKVACTAIFKLELDYSRVLAVADISQLS